MRWYIKLLTAVLALVFFAVLATLAIAGFLVYRIVKPQRTSSDINLQSFPGRPGCRAVYGAGRSERGKGWFFPGFRGASTIILCHGYGSSKGELLTLVSALQDHQYNVFVFDFAAHGANDGITTFGYREADEVRAAIDARGHAERRRSERVLVCGATTSARTRHCARPRATSACGRWCWTRSYDLPEQMVKVGVEQQGLGGFPLMARVGGVEF